jgi:hypothetical protein
MVVCAITRTPHECMTRPSVRATTAGTSKPPGLWHLESQSARPLIDLTRIPSSGKATRVAHRRSRMTRGHTKRTGRPHLYPPWSGAARSSSARIRSRRPSLTGDRNDLRVADRDPAHVINAHGPDSATTPAKRITDRRSTVDIAPVAVLPLQPQPQLRDPRPGPPPVSLTPPTLRLGDRLRVVRSEPHIRRRPARHGSRACDAPRPTHAGEIRIGRAPLRRAMRERDDGVHTSALPEPKRADRPRVLLGNATSHADRHGHGCPSAPAMQHCGGADHGRPPPLATNS